MENEEQRRIQYVLEDFKAYEARICQEKYAMMPITKEQELLTKPQRVC